MMTVFRAAPAAVDVGDVRVADRAGFQRYFNLTHFGRGKRDRFNGERGAELAANGGFDFWHGSILGTCSGLTLLWSDASCKSDRDVICRGGASDGGFA